MTHRAPRPARRWVAPVVVGTLIVVLAVGTALLRTAGTRDAAPPEGVRAELESLRDAVATCNAELAGEEARFQEHERAVDSLRAVVRGYESETRTVPAEEFDEYMEAFDAYNEAVAGWRERAAAVEARWEECRELTERHNELVESLTPGSNHS